MGGCSSKPSLTSENPDDYPAEALIIKIVQALRVPQMDIADESDPYVLIRIGGKKVHRSKYKIDDADPVFDELVDLSGYDMDDEVIIELWDRDRVNMNDRIGGTEMPLRELVKRPEISLLLHKKSGDMVVKKARGLPTELIFKVIKAPASWPEPVESEHYPLVDKTKYPKHVMIMTRGTRGDVQPYVALARGLASEKGWCCTICTELSFKSFVMKNAAGITNGAIRYRPSGGDTPKRIDSPIARWAMQHPSELMQIAMVARSEREFFASEPVLYHYCEQLQPDYLIYGFTMTSIAMILSEKFKIPACGFILQPTSIPSEHYAPVQAISSHYFSWIDRMESSLMNHNFQAKLKRWMEDSPFGAPLSKMRERRGLRQFKGQTSETHQILLDQRAPIVVPIHPVAFGGRPADWPESIRMTDFIFLRGGAQGSLNDHYENWLKRAKDAGDPCIVMCFSSMPVSREEIIQSAVKIVSECETHPRVIALSGAHITEKLSKKSQRALDDLTASGKIMEDRGVNFGALFPRLDALVIHGGLGTTAESMRCGVPVGVCGVLLMDQRFWGSMCYSLGIGPEMVHIKQFKGKCVEYVDSMLRDDSPMKPRAKEVASQMQATSADGVPENVAAVVEALATAKPIDTTSDRRGSQVSKASRRASQLSKGSK